MRPIDRTYDAAHRAPQADGLAPNAGVASAQENLEE
jgi:hypothetical protein